MDRNRVSCHMKKYISPMQQMHPAVYLEQTPNIQFGSACIGKLVFIPGNAIQESLQLCIFFFQNLISYHSR